MRREHSLQGFEEIAAALQGRPSLVEIPVLLTILALAACLRLLNVGWVPGYYSDEGTLLNIAANLAQGKAQYLALTQSTLLAARLPLFPILLTLLMKVGFTGIEAIRTLTGMLGVVAVFLLYWFVRQTDAPRRRSLALVSALALAIYPEAVVYSRVGFSYNLVACFFLLAAIGLWRYLNNGQSSGLALAAAAIGLGLISEVIALTLVPIFVFVASLRQWRAFCRSLLFLLLPPMLYGAFMLATRPQAFLFDLGFTLSRLSNVPMYVQPALATMNYAELVSQSTWVAVGTIGLFALRPARLRNLCLLLFFGCFLSVARTIIQISGLVFYYLVPLLPFVALGVAAVLLYGAEYVVQTCRDALAHAFCRWRYVSPDPLAECFRTTARALAAATLLTTLIVVPVLRTMLFGLSAAYAGYVTRMDPVLVDAASAQQVAVYVNAQVQPEDVVLASPAIAWMFRCRVADFQQAIAASGKATVHFPANVPPDRFAFNPDYRRARFVVVDNVWRNWGALAMSDVAQMLYMVRKWPMVFRAGSVEVYRNPAWHPHPVARP